MALIISRGFQGNAQNAAILALLTTINASTLWTTVELRAAFRAAPGVGEFGTIIPTGRVIWIPPSRCFVRGLTAVIDTGDILVAAGGATLASIGATNNAGDYQQVFITNQSTAAWNTAGGRAWGNPRLGPGFSATTNGTAEAGPVLFPNNGMFPGETQGAREIAAACDAGSYTGTLLLSFQFHEF